MLKRIALIAVLAIAGCATTPSFKGYTELESGVYSGPDPTVKQLKEMGTKTVLYVADFSSVDPVYGDKFVTNGITYIVESCSGQPTPAVAEGINQDIKSNQKPILILGAPWFTKDYIQ